MCEYVNVSACEPHWQDDHCSIHSHSYKPASIKAILAVGLALFAALQAAVVDCAAVVVIVAKAVVATV
jgi:hypothetical protein